LVVLTVVWWRRGPAVARDFLLNHQKRVSFTEDIEIRHDPRVTWGFKD
jgi:hypothetical protein